MSKNNYAGKRQASARKRAAAMLPCPCFRCGRIVTAEMNWHADHTLSRAEARAMGMPDAEVDALVQPSHASCNVKHNKRVGQGRSGAKARVVEPIKRPSIASFPDDDAQPLALPLAFSPLAGGDAA